MNNDKKQLVLNKKVSSIDWIGKKVSGQHNGTILLKEGVLDIEKGKIKSGKITIDMESITCSDLEGDWNKKLIGHLNSADFFDVKNHKTATLEIKEVKNIEKNKFNVSGDLTIKGITKEINFPATIEFKDGKLAAFAEVNVDRTLYDIKYGSGKFFEDLGDKMIDDLFTIKFKIAAE
jgi:polyisoprenoid-binding protein YceI